MVAIIYRGRAIKGERATQIQREDIFGNGAAVAVELEKPVEMRGTATTMIAEQEMVVMGCIVISAE
jgi:hypothetical protein